MNSIRGAYEDCPNAWIQHDICITEPIFEADFCCFIHIIQSYISSISSIINSNYSYVFNCRDGDDSSFSKFSPLSTPPPFYDSFRSKIFLHYLFSQISQKCFIFMQSLGILSFSRKSFQLPPPRVFDKFADV